MAEQSHDRSCDVHPKSRDYEERIERLQVELEKKTSMLMEVRRHLHEAVEREKQLKSLSADPKLSEKYLSVVREKEHLEQQVVQVSHNARLVSVLYHGLLLLTNQVAV